MTIAVAIVAFAAGAGLAWIILWGRGAALAERLRASEANGTRLAAELAAERASRAEAAEVAARLASALDSEKTFSKQRLADLSAAHEALKTEFTALSSSALRANSDDFLTLAKKAFAELRAESAGDLATRQQAIDSLVKPLKESLEKVDAKIGELEEKRARAYGELGQQLESLGSAQQRMQLETTKLSSALSTTRTAGTWGEVQLRRVVELAGMIEHCDFDEQQVQAGEDNRGRPDLVVSLPGGQRIAVDAKAPTEAFREAAAEPDDKLRRAKLMEHAARVRAHVDALSQREYWARMQPSPDYVVLFLPGDSFLSAAIESDPAIMDRAIGKRVLLATPMTLIALLKAAAYGWEQEKFSRNAEEVKTLGRDLYDRIATFAGHMENASKGLSGAVRHFNAAVGSLEVNVAAGARKFADLGAKGVKDLGEVTRVELEVREVTRKG